MSAPLGFPATHRELWARWLGYRIPHWDALERTAASTLTGSQTAKVRVWWDASTGTPAEWHATLFTLTAETPEPERTMAAAREYQPAGVLLHHVLTDDPHPHAAALPDPRPSDLAALVDKAFAARRALAELEGDFRLPAATLECARRASEALVDCARAEVEQAITHGLRARNGFPLVPPMVVKPQMMGDRVLYHLTFALRTALAPPGGDRVPWRPRGIAVCRACTTVFVPRRRTTGEFCPLCRKRPAEPFVVGQRRLEPGTSQIVRAPNLASTLILGWTTTTIGLCPDCEAPFSGRRDATACPDCANRARQRRHRKRRANADR